MLRILFRVCTEPNVLNQLVEEGYILQIVRIAEALLEYREVSTRSGSTTEEKPKTANSVLVAGSFRCTKRAYTILCSWFAALFAKIVAFDQNFDV